MSKFYVTTAIVYINTTPHLGFIYELTGTDVLARYHRMIGDETFFLTGSDEHSLNVERRAREEGLSTKDFSDRVAEVYRQIESQFQDSYGRFIPTEEPRHDNGVPGFVGKIKQHGDNYKGTTEG